MTTRKIDPINKKAYFQGGGGINEPTPHKKKYKSEKAIVIQPRFKEPFYRNYDAYETDNELGPGAGWHHMNNYKSISEFLKNKRKRMENKYKADDSWIEEPKSENKNTNKIKIRANLLSRIIKTAIDFPIDEQVTPILGDAGTYSDSIPIGGMLDEYLPLPDFEDKTPDQLNFGRDYVDNNLEKIIEKYSPSSKESSLFGLPDGISPQEDLDAPSSENPWYGTTDSGNTLYNNMWI